MTDDALAALTALLGGTDPTAAVEALKRSGCPWIAVVSPLGLLAYGRSGGVPIDELASELADAAAAAYRAAAESET